MLVSKWKWEGRKQTSSCSFLTEESHLSLQVFDPSLGVGRESTVILIRQTDAAVGAGVHICLRHSEGHSRRHWIRACEGVTRLLVVLITLANAVLCVSITTSKVSNLAMIHGQRQ